MSGVLRRSHLKLQQMRSTAAFLSPLWSAMKRAGPSGFAEHLCYKEVSLVVKIFNYPRKIVLLS